MLKRCILLCFVLMLMAAPLSGCFTAAATAYDTYTYNYDGEARRTPDAYLPKTVDLSLDLFREKFKEPSDLFISSAGDIFVVDTGNNRIVVFGPDYSIKNMIINFVNPLTNEMDSLSGPSGIFVTQDNILYIADTGNERIVVMDTAGNLHKILTKPVSDVFSTSLTYTPVAVAVDKAGRIYVISKNGTMGVIALNNNGQIESFLGAQSVTINLFDIIWRIFQTDEQRRASSKFIPTEYNNITVDSDGFLYVTSSAVNGFEQYNAMSSRSKDTKFAPIKKLNPSGIDVLKRNGFFPPAGDIEITHAGAPGFYPSRFIDAAVTENGQYSVLDNQRNRIFTYNSEGDLLYAFGKTGTQTGTFDNAISLVYNDTDILVLDKGAGAVSVFYRTDYGNSIAKALELQESRQYTAARDMWKTLLNKNVNLDIAHIGIGKTLYRQGKYEEAMRYFQDAGDTENYSKAFSEYRKNFLKANFLPLFFIAMAFAAFLWLIHKFLRKQQQQPYFKGQKLRYLQEFSHAFQVLTRPIKRYGDIAMEGRGSVPVAITIILLTAGSMVFSGAASGYLFSSKNTSVFMQTGQIILPLILWCGCNWALTTLMNGEGSLKKIFLATGYGLLPIPLLVFPLTILSNLMTGAEAGGYFFLLTFAFIWAFLLIFIGNMVIHDYPLGKNILTVVLTVVCMVFVTFLILLFTDLVQRVINFFVSIYEEITFRL